MVTKEDIEHVTKLMRIDIGDANEHFERVQKILNYFDSLDEADVESEEIPLHEISINDLRDDKHIPFESKLISKLKSYRGSFVRAPKMS